VAASVMLLGAGLDGCGSTPARPPADGGGAGQGGAPAGTGCPDAGLIVAGVPCDTGSACAEDPERPGRGTCGCVAGIWRCSYSECPTNIYWGIMTDGSQCAYIDGVPAGCACASRYSPEQGHSYCICTAAAPTGDAGGG